MQRRFRVLLHAAGWAAFALAAGCAENITSPSPAPGAVVQTIVPGVDAVGELSAGGYHTCALKTDGTVTCWGRNFSGQATPPAGLIAVQLSAGHNHVCALKPDGTLACWGYNGSGQTTVPPGVVASQVGSGAEHSCAVKIDSTVVCWGENGKGQSSVPAGLTSVAQVVPGLDHTCALKTDASVICWGSNFNDQLAVPAGLSAVQLSGQWLHICAAQASGTAACWGYGPLAAMPAGIVATEISPGNAHNCALKTDGTVTCWGYNAEPLPEAWAQHGQTTVPPGLSSVAHVRSGSFHTCALKTDGTVVCWGLNDTGQTNVPSGLNLIITQSQTISFTSTIPVTAFVGGTFNVTATGGGSGNPVTFGSVTPSTCTVAGASVDFVGSGTCTIAADQNGNASYTAASQATRSITVIDAVGIANERITAGTWHTCVLRLDGSPACWGMNEYGQSSPPAGLGVLTQLNAGNYHTCAIKSNGTAACWGVDASGQTTVPAGLGTVLQIDGGYQHTCAVKSDRTIACWGENGNGQATVPAGLGPAKQVTTGAAQSCALETIGTVVCWGDNTSGQTSVPAGLNAVVQISAGHVHVCALKVDGSVACWGSSGGPTVQVPAGLTGVARINAGTFHTCAVKLDSTVTCWGYNPDGQSTPPPGLNTASQTAGGFYHTCALKTDEQIVCWGGGANGQLSVPGEFTNHAPVANAGGPYSGSEGSSVAFSGAGSADADLDVLTYAWTFGDGATGTGVAPIHAYADNATYTVSLTVTDAHGVSSAPVSTTAAIANVAPTILSLTLLTDPVPVGSTVGLAGAFTDLSTLDTHTATVNWDDGAGALGAAVNQANRTVSASRTFTEAGVYAVSLVVIDDDGGSATHVAAGYLVVFDPSAGFVTGGGWIISPSGSYAANPALTGKANFGFVSRYQKGATSPTGNTEFQFHAGSFEFSSSSNQWLVVAGANAKFKGTGTINGGGNYGFILSATDGQENGGGGIDRFRMKIWNVASGNVIYDNQAGSSDDAVVTTAIGGGSIVIHK